jgi:DNA repair exonuclease SbcCD nuclease subunit
MIELHCFLKRVLVLGAGGNHHRRKNDNKNKRCTEYAKKPSQDLIHIIVGHHSLPLKEV